jgi:CheY-like chemotaxis protein
VAKHRHHPGIILVVEDDEETAQSLAEIIRLMGHAAEIAGNGRIALERLREPSRQYCLVLLDIMMPVMDGWTFLHELQQDEDIADTPVVIMTAALDAKRKAAETSAVAVMPKPVDPPALASALRQYC